MPENVVAMDNSLSPENQLNASDAAMRSISNQSNASAMTYVYEPDSNPLRGRSPHINSQLPSPVASHTATAIGNGKKVVVIGGDLGREQSSTVNIYNAATKVWTVEKVDTAEAIPEPIAGHSADLIGDKIYVFGGWNVTDRKRNELDQFLALDVTSAPMSWHPGIAPPPPVEEEEEPEVPSGKGGKGDKKKAAKEEQPAEEVPPPEARVFHGSFVLGTRLFIHGGSSGARRRGDMHRFDTESNTWAPIETTGEAPGNIANHKFVVYKDKAILFGGSDGALVNDQVYSFAVSEDDPNAGQWTRIGAPNEDGTVCHNFNIPLVWHGVALVGDKVLRYGGSSGRVGQNEEEVAVWSLNLSELLASTETYIAQSAPPASEGKKDKGGKDKDKDRPPTATDDSRDEPIIWPEWEELGISGAAPGRRQSHTFTAVTGMLVVFGGNDGSRLSNAVYEMDIDPDFEAPSGTGTCQYANGDYYSGKWKRGKRSGEGTCTYANGDVYVGLWSQDQRHGNGVCEYGNGDKYEGPWRFDGRHGFGVCVYSNNDRYEGNWEQDMRVGEGKLVCDIDYMFKDSWKTGFTGAGVLRSYVGQWEDDLQGGEGVGVYADKDVYEGPWKRGKPHGYGTTKFANGNVYEGHYDEGESHGEGKMTYANTDIHVGVFRNGKRNGKGCCQYHNGSSYDGKWRGDKRSGFGTLISATGAKYVGDWQNGLMHGHGTNFYLNGDVYEGSWANNMRDGWGSCEYSNGDKYNGQWKKDKRCTDHTGENEGVGPSVCVYMNRDVYEGDWMNNQRNGNGRANFANGDSYDGEWVEDQMNGEGTYVSSSETYTGTFKDGHRHGYGVCQYANGDVYKGTWRRGVRKTWIDDTDLEKFSGKASLDFGNGDVYVGEFDYNKPNGLGTCTYANKDVYEGCWKDGKREGEGKCTFASGDVYVGEWHSDTPETARIGGN